MPKSKSRKKKPPKRVLALPDLEHAKTAVLNSLTSASGQRPTTAPFESSSPGTVRSLAARFNRIVVLRYRTHLEQRGYVSRHDARTGRR
jgi:hypothetical protein